MNKLNLIAVLAFSLTFISCSNIQGNQTDEKATVENNDDKSSNQVTPEYLTYETFKEKVWDFEKNPQEWIYEGDVPCVIDFYADWCKPCKMVAPIMDELAIKYEGKVKIYKIDTDKEKELAGVFGIRSIPLVLFSGMEGRPSKQAGALQKADYINIIETQLLNNKPQ